LKLHLCHQLPAAIESSQGMSQIRIRKILRAPCILSFHPKHVVTHTAAYKLQPDGSQTGTLLPSGNAAALFLHVLQHFVSSIITLVCHSMQNTDLLLAPPSTAAEKQKITEQGHHHHHDLGTASEEQAPETTSPHFQHDHHNVGGNMCWMLTESDNSICMDRREALLACASLNAPMGCLDIALRHVTR